MALVGLCLAAAFGGCLNPLTDDQPSRRPASVDVGEDLGGAPRAPETENPVASSGDPGDFLTDDGEGPPAPNTPAYSPAGPQEDAGVGHTDAGPDSRSSEAQ